MKKKIFSGTTKHIMALIFLFSCVPIVLIITIFFAVYYNSQDERSGVVQKEIAQRIAVSISDMMDKYISDSKVYAKLIKDNGFNSDKMRNFALYLSETNSEYDDISVADAKGDVKFKVSRYRAITSEDYKNIAARESYSDALAGRIHISEIQLSEHNHSPYIYITVPLESAKGTSFGVLELGINVSKIWQIISKHQTGNNRDVYIVDRNGYLIIRKEKPSFLEKRDCKTIEAVARFVENKPGVYRYNGLSGKSVFGATVTIPLMHWGVVVEEPLLSAMRDIYILTAVFALISFLTIIATVYSDWHFSYNRFVSPLKYFEKEASLIAKGDLSRTINITSDDEIGQLALTFNRMTETISSHTNYLETLIKDRTEDLNERNLRLTALLDNADEGFLSFSKDMIVEPEFSKECRDFFGDDIAGKEIASLLFENDESAVSFFRRTFSLILKTDDDFKKEMLMGVLPGEMKLRGHNVRVKYRTMENGKTMLVLTNITREKRFEEKIFDERLRLRLVVASILNRNDIIDICSSFRIFLNKYSENISSENGATAEDIDELFRQSHTYKGLFNLFDFIYLPQALHAHESRLSEMKKAGSPSPESVRMAFAESCLLTHLERDLAIVKEILGDSFFTPSNDLVIDETRLRTLEEEIVAACRAAGNDRLAEQIFAIVSSLHKVNLKRMLKLYPGHTLALAEILGKEVKPFMVTGDDVFVDPKKFAAFTESLVAVFRNVVSHAIQTVSKKRKSGKEGAGTVHCSVSMVDGSIVITISDDGRGIDPKRVHRVALASGLRSREQLEGMTDQQKMLLIFEDGFSTRGDLDEISGRGFGLAAVKYELENLHGTVSIESEPDKGASFIFTIPLKA